MTSSPVTRVFARVVGLLDRAGFPVAVMGGFAVRFWAIPRATYDVDFAVAADGDELLRLVKTFDGEGFVVDRQFLGGFTDNLEGLRKINVGCFEAGTVWRIDVFLATTPFVRSAFDRRVPAEIDGMKCAVVTVEDLLLFKLLANRNKDRADVEDLLLVCGSLDTAYLRSWAERLVIGDRLDRALRDGGRS